MAPKDLHLERAALCDVFLDTLLVNAHTVGGWNVILDNIFLRIVVHSSWYLIEFYTAAMDISWASLPLITLPHERCVIVSAISCF